MNLHMSQTLLIDSLGTCLVESGKTQLHLPLSEVTGGHRHTEVERVCRHKSGINILASDGCGCKFAFITGDEFGSNYLMMLLNLLYDPEDATFSRFSPGASGLWSGFVCFLTDTTGCQKKS